MFSDGQRSGTRTGSEIRNLLVGRSFFSSDKLADDLMSSLVIQSPRAFSRCRHRCQLISDCMCMCVLAAGETIDICHQAAGSLQDLKSF